MILLAETSLLVAVRERLLDALGIPQDAIQIELDDEAFLDRLRSTNTLLSEVSRVLRHDYDTIEIANADLVSQGVDGKFVQPLVPTSVDGKPRMATADLYDSGRANSGGNTQVVMVRGINFSGAEFIGKMVEQ